MPRGLEILNHDDRHILGMKKNQSSSLQVEGEVEISIEDAPNTAFWIPGETCFLMNKQVARQGHKAQTICKHCMKTVHTNTSTTTTTIYILHL